jgi:hypothetical protein
MGLGEVTVPVVRQAVDRFDEGVELLDGREIGIIPRLGEDLRGSPQPTPLRTDARQVAGARLLGIPTPAAVLERGLRHRCSPHSQIHESGCTGTRNQSSEHPQVRLIVQRHRSGLAPVKHCSRLGWADALLSYDRYVAHGGDATGPPVGSTAYPTEQDHHRASGAAH